MGDPGGPGGGYPRLDFGRLSLRATVRHVQEQPSRTPVRQVASKTSSPAHATRRVAVLDYLGVPYELADAQPEDDRLVVVERGSAFVCWPAADTLDGLAAGLWRLGETTIAARVLPDDAADAILGPGWSPTHPIRAGDGPATSSVRQGPDGRVFLPFDPDEVVMNLWSEAYGEFASSPGSASGGAAPAPLLPPAACHASTFQLALRRRAVSFQRRVRFPRWPVEPSLHDVFDLVLELLDDPDDPVPWIAAWPAPYRWAIVLTHDVETSYGLTHLSLLRELELEAGFRSSWNLVPRRYEVSDELVAELTRDGFEVGVHGLYHDGRDLESPELIRRRLPEIRRWAERWAAVGFRAPATHRAWDAMPTLGFEYDTSYPDTDPFEPQAGGCCSWLPFTHGDMVELPITLPQDHTLYEILREPALERWRSKADAVRERGGMALLITHPDYMVPPERLRDYRDFLAFAAADAAAWRALPRDVCAWWRRRLASRLVRTGDEWSIEGPAAGEGAVSYGPGRRILR